MGNSVLPAAAAGIQLILLARLFLAGVARRYPVLTVYLGFGVVRGALMVYLLQSGKRLLGLQGYGLVYVVTQPVLWVFYFLLLLEFYSVILEDFPGVRRLGRLVLFSALVAVTLVCCVVIVLDEQAGMDPYPVLAYLVVQERSIFLSLSALTLSLLWFAWHFRLSIRRNVWVLCACFGGYFLAGAMVLTLRRYFGQDFAPLRNLSNALFYFVALLGAVLFLSKAGETETHPISVIWGRRNRELEAALAVQLRSFNQVLVKTLRQ